MKKGKYILLTLILIILLAAAVLCIRYLPYLRAAGFLQKNLDLQKMSFDVTVTLSREGLTEEQKKFVDTLSQVTGIAGEDLLALRLKGSTWQDMIYVEITPGASGTVQAMPLTELYLRNDNDLVNAKMLYDAVLKQLSGQLGMLGGLLPQWKGGEYVSLTQAEQMFDLDLQTAKEFEIGKYQEWFSFPAYFVLAMEVDFEMEQDGRIVFSMENLPETLQRFDNMLARVGMDYRLAERTGLRNIQSIAGSIRVEEPSELQMPESLIQQDTVEKIATLRKIIQELMGL